MKKIRLLCIIVLVCIVQLSIPQQTIDTREQGLYYAQVASDLQTGINTGPVNQDIEQFARQFNFSLRSVAFPQHSILGTRLRPEQLASPLKEIYTELREVDYWNVVDFQNFNLNPNPVPPFRLVTVGELVHLGSQRYEVQIELESFRETFYLSLVLRYNEGIQIVLVRSTSDVVELESEIIEGETSEDNRAIFPAGR